MSAISGKGGAEKGVCKKKWISSAEGLNLRKRTLVADALPKLNASNLPACQKGKGGRLAEEVVQI